MNHSNAIQAGLLEDAIRIGELRAEIAGLEALLDDPGAAWNCNQAVFLEALNDAKAKHAQALEAAAAEAERVHQDALAARPLLQNVWEKFLAQANGDELSVMRARDQTYGVGWWLDIQSPFFLDLCSDPIKALVASAFRALRLSRFESQLRNKKSRLSQFQALKKFPAPSGIATFLEASESKSLGLRHVLNRPDAEASVKFMLALPVTTLENPHDAGNYR